MGCCAKGHDRLSISSTASDWAVLLSFFVPSVKLCIEIDGGQHAERRDLDAARDAYLAQFGILTLRNPLLDLFYQEQDRYSAWIREVASLR